MRSALAAVALLSLVAPMQFAQAGTVGIFDSTALKFTDGQQIYAHICQGCHMPDGKGAVGAGRYPALAKDPAIASRQFMELTLLLGRRNMPAFGGRHALGFVTAPVSLTEEQIAAVVNYVRTHFGNHYTDKATADEIRALDRPAN
jgi:mono/diheme cytochrome c family protein